MHLTGTLSAGPELRYTKAGAAITSFPLHFVDPTGAEKTTMVVCAKEVAEHLALSLSFGERVIVVGAYRQWVHDGVSELAFAAEDVAVSLVAGTVFAQPHGCAVPVSAEALRHLLLGENSYVQVEEGVDHFEMEPA
jgi:hypothetical protein